MIRLLLILVLTAVLTTQVADAQMGVTYFPGPGMYSSTSGGCGNGTIDLSSGCALAVFGGL